MTYVERDVRCLLAIENQQAFELLMRLLAGSVSQEINYSRLSIQVGISAPQIKRWLGVLEASFILFKLPPYFNNLGKESGLYFFRDHHQNEIDLLYP